MVRGRDEANRCCAFLITASQPWHRDRIIREWSVCFAGFLSRGRKTPPYTR
jgi:hypothetical protein